MCFFFSQFQQFFRFFIFGRDLPLFLTQNCFVGKFLFFKNRPPPPPKKRGYEKGPKSTKKFWDIFWVQNIIFCKLTTSKYLTKKIAHIVSSYGQKIIFIREFHYPGFFYPPKNGDFHDQNSDRDIFPLLLGSQLYLHGINCPNRSSKKKFFLVFLNQRQKYGDFYENSRFFKNNSKKWGGGGVRRGRYFCPMKKIYQKIFFFRYIP